MSKFFSTILFLTLITFFSINAFAQNPTGTIEGTVTDQNGAVIPGATVFIELPNNSAGFKKTVTTNENGYFVITEIPPGSYTIRISAQGFAEFPKNVEVLAGKSITIIPILKGVSTTLGGVPSKNVRLSTRLDNETKFIIESYEEIPAKTTFDSILKIVPFVRPEILSGGFQINGASGSENTFFIDGQASYKFPNRTIKLE